ncbi:MAG: RNA 3'-terminal phosphate cyclase [Verrucomicrobiota bacterium]
MITIDGSQGEGGGQILRTSLALAIITGKALRLENIRAGRAKPGLMRQHLTAVKAAAEVSGGRLTGAEVGSTNLTFEPDAVRPGAYRFAVGTAGSCTLVLQTVLPALLQCEEPSEVILEGGTHNPFAPPFDFLEKVFADRMKSLGGTLRLTLERSGYYPAGGGCFKAVITPRKTRKRFKLLERGGLKDVTAYAVISRLPQRIGVVETKKVAQRLNLREDKLRVIEDTSSPGPGNVVFVEVRHEQVTELFAGFGEKNVAAQKVAEQVARQARDYLTSTAPVGPYLADQLLVPVALANGGSFRATKITRHTSTNMDVIRAFLPVEITRTELDDGTHQIELSK